MAPRLAVAVAALAVILLQAACSAVPLAGSNGETLQVEGLVVDIEQSEGDLVARFVLLGDDGRTYEFRTDGDTRDAGGRKVTASHMRQDAALGTRFVVSYREEGGALVANEVDHPDGH